MKSIKLVVFCAFIAVSAFFVVMYTSCSKDACKGVTCQNGGTCSGGNCTCTTGYEGTNCEILSRTKFVKSWSASDLITGGSLPLSYTANIAAGVGSDVTQVIIGNSFSDNFFTIGPITATISGTTTGGATANTITIPSQNPDGNKYSLSGSATLANGILTWSYTIKNDSSSATQVYSGTWQ